MTDHDDCRRLMDEALRELQAVPGADIEFFPCGMGGEPQNEPSPEEVDGVLLQHFGTSLPASVSACSAARESYSGVDWRIELPSGPLGGDFHLRPPAASIPMIPISLDWELSDFENELAEELFVIDFPAAGADDALAALRLQPGTESPEVWYQHGEIRALRLDLDYCTYLRTLAVTKGVWGWHVLFADVSFSDPDFRAYNDSLEGMLTVFPELFPNHDYTHLRKRLKERL